MVERVGIGMLQGSIERTRTTARCGWGQGWGRVRGQGQGPASARGSSDIAFGDAGGTSETSLDTIQEFTGRQTRQYIYANHYVATRLWCTRELAVRHICRTFCNGQMVTVG